MPYYAYAERLKTIQAVSTSNMFHSLGIGIVDIGLKVETKIQ